MSKVESSKCQSCGYTLKYSPTDQALKCVHCGSVAHIADHTIGAKKDYTPESSVEKNKNQNSMHECTSCGAKTNVGETVSGVCPYCGASNIKELADAISYTPDGLVPFKITKEEAGDRYKQWAKTRKFVPNKFKKVAQLDKSEGAYIPCWLYDFDVDSTYRGVGIEKHTKTVYRTNSNGTRVAHRETYETRHPFSGSRTDNFVNYIYSASNSLSQKEVKGLGNFGLENLKAYDTAYLLGFLSSSYDQDVHTSFDQTKVDAKSEIANRVKNSYHYDRIENFSMQSKFYSIKWQYVYLPVYLCNFNYKKKSYRCVINGYTGHVTGKTPKSVIKITAFVLAIVLGVGALAYLFSMV